MNVRSEPADIQAPPLPLLLQEIRVFGELPRFMLRNRALKGLPRGDGHPVMIVPGFGASDLNTLPLRRALGRLGYTVLGWQQGVNIGMRPRVKQALAAELAELHDRYEQTVSLVGWSLGGVYAREMARHQPDHVRRVVTLGSPINGRPDANNLNALFRLANLGKPLKVDLEGFKRRIKPPPVPCTAIYTKSDGLVAWQCALEDTGAQTRNVEVRGSHMGLIYNLDVLAVLAKLLAEPA